MTVRIGHASIDENGKASGGRAGDQTGRELCTRLWYDKGWNVLLRPASRTRAEKSARMCEAACENENIGYDQCSRNTLYEQAKAVGFELSKITAACECDCSALMHVCAVAGGAAIPFTGNCCTTRTMAREFANTGAYIRLTGKEFLESDEKLLRGDILVKEGSHTVMVLSDGTGSAPEETPEEAPEEARKEAWEADCGVMLPRLEKEQWGDAVKALQQLLQAKGYGCEGSGHFDNRTENALLCFQQDFNLVPDGICGSLTWSALLGLTGVG